MNSARLNSSLFVALAFIFSCLMWGHTNVVMRMTFSPDCPASLSVAIRLTLATMAALVGWWAWAPEARPTRRQAFQAGWAGILSGMAFLLLYYAVARTPKLTNGLTSTVMALQPSVIAGIIYFKNRRNSSPWILTESILGFAGIYFIHQASQEWSADIAWSILILVISALLNAVAYFPLDSAGDLNVHPRLTLVLAAMSAIGWIGHCFGIGERPPEPGGWSPWMCVLAFVYLATFGMVLPYYAFLHVLSARGKNAAAMTDFAVPLVAIAVDLAWLKESMQMGTWGIIGIALVLSSILISLLRKSPPESKASP